MDGRSRLSRGSVERHTLQLQPIIGTPCDVPVPRNRTRAGTDVTLREPQGDGELVEPSRDDDTRGSGEPSGSPRRNASELVEELLEQLPLLGRQVAAGLQLEQQQDVDDLLRRRRFAVPDCPVTGSGTSPK
jgi:hypothetical protein